LAGHTKMAQTNFTPISLYYSTTASAAPTAGNLVAGELAINTNDGVLYYKDSSGVVQKLATKGGVGTSSTTQVLYNNAGLIAGSSNMTFNGTTLTLANDASISGLTVGKGGGSSSTSTAFGVSAAFSNSSGNYITAIGYLAAYSTTNNSVCAIGGRALYANTTGGDNTAIGNYNTLASNTTGSSNIAIGRDALQANTTASNNTAVGYQAGYSNTTATGMAYFGYLAGYSTTGASNTFIGYGAGNAVTSGAKNTILGTYNGNNGGLDIRTASNYIVLSDGDGNPRAYWNNSGVYVCPATYSNTTTNPANVNVDAGGGFYRSTSALKYKKDVRDLPSIDINKLRPVIYKSKCENDDQTKDYFGFIADEVDAVGIKELVNYNEDGQVESLQYERMTAVLVKAIQELKAEFDVYKSTHP